MTISYQPWYVSQTYPIWDIPLTTDSGPDDLTNVNVANITLYFRDGNGVDARGIGTLSIKAVSPAEILYKPDPTEVAAPFNGWIVIKVLFPPSNGITDEAVYSPIPFVITPA